MGARPADVAHRVIRPNSRQRRRRSSRRARVLGGIAGLAVMAVVGHFALEQAGYKMGLPQRSDIVSALDRAVMAAGLGINQVSITGYRKTQESEILSALALEPARSILAYDLTAARARLAELPWVETAELTRVLPDGLTVRIGERKPYAVLQRRNLLFVIDGQGRDLDPVGPRDYSSLPVVVGDGAGEAAALLIESLAAAPALAGKLASAQRVGGRRWTLKLHGGLDILLPAGDPIEAPRLKAALGELQRLVTEDRLLDRDLAAIDLRLPGRLSLRLTDTGARAFRDEAKRRAARLAQAKTEPGQLAQGL